MNVKDLYDAIIVGGGPAGLAAAIYLGRARYRVLVVEKENFGGQIRITEEVVNYPGILATDGPTLSANMRQQAQNFGAEFTLAEVRKISTDGDLKLVETDRGVFKSLGLIIACGARPRRIGFAGEKEFQGRGVAYCATCDGEFFTGKEILVIGGGLAAVEEADFLTKYASKVTILVRRDQFRAERSAVEKILANPKIEVKFNHELKEVSGQKQIEEALIYNNKTGETFTFKPDNGDTFGVFVLAGREPASDLVKDLVELNKSGYIITDASQQTSLEGVFAAGDICIKPLRQVVTAVSDGAIAATELEKYAAGLHDKLGLVPEQPKVEKGNSVASQGKTQPASSSAQAQSDSFLDQGISDQLRGLAERFTNAICLKVYSDTRPISRSLEKAMQEIAELSPKFSYANVPADQEGEVPLAERPCVRILTADGSFTGLAFHGVPGGHEFQSFVLGLYNAAGPGQALSEDLVQEIKGLKAAKMQIIVSLTCTQCPDLVVAAQKIASLNPEITADVYDVAHFEDLRDTYDVMSVPCLVFNDGAKVDFGKKSIDQLVTILREM